MNEKRSSARVRTLKGGRILLNNGYSTFDCVIRNLSETGAKLKLDMTAPLPDAFELLIHEGQRYRCEVRWRKGAEVGVKFI
ncbi:PilZ domain-containing protein [Allorhizobium sp. BGMRC 0089]|uniref:PilZ domain-containing protein n=1 Tax=Allorhizobium sonneratiae TaxID=2934936 RepID=UPI002033DC45|nr:PilZ domain-containing protein [Allorhizobium sonneratiae]MCM2293191.1 PilZ domain-containing protein [Allorhizobium sonneratiae]